MIVTKKINNNVAMARDEKGNEFVVFGKGIGFPKTPYQLTDESVIQGIYSNMQEGIMSMVRGIPGEIIDASLEITDLAKRELDVELNPNMFLTLADHLQFAVERTQGGYVIENPLAGTVEFVYPKEYTLGQRGLEIFAAVAGTQLPESEACSIAMHIVNSEQHDSESVSDMDEVMRTLTTINEITNIVEESIGATVDRSSYSYARFTTHLRYLIKRLRQETEESTANLELFDRIAHDFPEVRACADKISAYLEERYVRTCGNEERLYLMMYINRFLANR